MNRHFTVRPPIPRIIVGSVWQRVTVLLVTVYHQQLFERHKVIIVSGKDPLGFNQVTQPPPYS